MGFFDKNTQELYVSCGTQYLAFDDTNKVITIATPYIDGKTKFSFTKKMKTYSYNELESYYLDVALNEKTSKGVAGALVGGVLLGPVGAVAGGLSRRGVDKSKIIRSNVFITLAGTEYRLDLNDPMIKNSLDMLDAIGNKIETIIPTKTEDEDVSVADELLKFKALLDSGAITEEEYQEQKEKLLNK